MAFVFDVNRHPATISEAIFRFKEVLKTAGWTVPRSSDGTTYNSSGDQVTHGGSGANGMNNTRAWFVIEVPAGAVAPYTTVRQFCWQISSAPGTSQRIKYASGATFTLGAPAATVTPSATGEQILIGAGTDAAPTFAGISTAASGEAKFHCAADNAEPFGWWWTFLTTGTGAGASAFFFDPVQSGTYPYGTPGMQDEDPYVIYTASGTLVWTSSLYDESTGPRAFLKKTLLGEGFVRMPLCTWGVGGEVYYGGGVLGVNIETYKDDIVNVLYLRRAALTAPVGYKGMSSMIRRYGGTRVSGDTLSEVAARDLIVLGGVVLPWNGSVPVI
jgi:hypothetical protein